MLSRSTIKSNERKSSKTTRRASEKVSMTVRESNGIKNAISIVSKALLLFTLGLFIIFPFYYMLSISLMSWSETQDPSGIALLPSNPSFEAYVTVFFRGYVKAFVFSLLVMLTNVLLKVVVCIMIGYAFAMYDFKFKKIIWALLISSMAIPEVALIASQYDMIINLGIDSGILILVGLSAPFIAQVFTMYMFRNGFETIPNSVKEAAMIDGITGKRFFFKIAVPMISSTIWTVVILTAFMSWNSYIWPSLVLGGSIDLETMSLWLFSSSKNDVDGSTMKNLQMASATLTIAPTIIIYLIFKKRIDNTVAAAGGDKG